MYKIFRATSLLEGISYLIILSVTVGFISRDYVSTLGMVHGILFLIYIVLSLIISNKKQWPIITWFGLFVAALIPFAFLSVEYFLKKNA